jgi:hypothetical protein
VAIDQLGIYNKALIKVGTSVLETLTDNRDEVESLDAIWDLNAVDYCLEVVKPVFARKTTKSTGAATTGGVTLAYTHTLPSDYITLVGVYSDSELDQQVNRFAHEGSTIVCDYEVVYIRYVHNATAVTGFSPGFVDVLSGYLAREIAPKVRPDRAEEIDASLQTLVEQVIASEEAKEPSLRPAAEGSSLSAAWRTIYNGALMILGKDKLPAGDTDSPWRVAMDTSVADGVVDNVMEDTEWQFGVSSIKSTYDPAVVPPWGYQYVHDRPGDLQRLAGIFTDERMRYPLKNYVEEGGKYVCDYQEIYIKYIDSVWNTQPSAWPRYFARLVAAQIAVDVAPIVAPEFLQHAIDIYKRRKQSAKTNDTIQSPPQMIHGGGWLASRGDNRSDRNRP